MQKYLQEYLEELSKRQKKQRKTRIAITILVVLVVTSIAGILSQYGVAMTGTAKCGLEEHQHGEECYEEVLVCGLEEGESHTHTEDCLYPPELTCGLEESEGHTHTEECLYPPELTCGLEESEEHTHTEECYTIPEGYACGLEESEGHTHTDECYTVPEGYACGLEETESHTHTEDCYEKILICEKEEHVHTDACYIDASADVEEQAVWDNQYAEADWKEAWGEDLVAAAQIQVGYKESINNYTVAENGSHKGYTRYGQFAGDVYCNWDAAFVNFCMYYAGLKESGFFPEETDTAKWREEFVNISEANAAYLTGTEDYVPTAGDLVFFQKENEETTDQMGIVSSVDEENRTIKAIEGNNGNEVKETEYSLDDEQNHIVGYLNITELESAYKNGTSEPEETEEPEEPAAAEEPEGTEEAAAAEEPEEPVIELTTEVDGIIITLSGPESSFEAGREYSIQAEKITEEHETIEAIEEAVEQVAEEKEKEVEDFQAFDIRLFAEDEEVQPIGPVEVKFSGDEVQNAVEDETTEISVIHVDEDTGEATDMEAAATDENEVVIETDHFSVYVYVYLTDTDLVGKVKVTVQHWSWNVQEIAYETDSKVAVTVPDDQILEDAGVEDGKKKKKVKQTTVKTEIYSDDTLPLPNEYYRDVKELSKLCSSEAAHYDVDKIWISTDWTNATRKGIAGGEDAWINYVECILKDDNDTDNDTDTNTNTKYFIGEQDNEDTKAEIEGNEIKITGSRIEIGDRTLNITDPDHPVLIRFWYSANNDEDQYFDTPTAFYDYDLSSDIVTGKTMYTEEKGINSRTNYADQSTTADANRLGIGQTSSGNKSSWTDTARVGASGTKLLNKGNTNTDSMIVTGIVGNTLSPSGQLVFNVQAPQNLFNVAKDAAGNSIYTGSTEYANYDLRFLRNGDTYTLQNVYNNNKTGDEAYVTGDLTKFTQYDHYESYTGMAEKYLKEGGFGPLYSNNFWPMDDVTNNDPHMGRQYGTYSFLSDNGSSSTHSASDDSLDHNWHFGMKYEVEFTVGDYTGPMEYYFRGDDDFWLFIDGQLAVDIGGIHSSIGQYLDLRAWMEDKGLLENKNQKHTLKVFYMERGGFGSCCYMQFTIPNSEAVEIPLPETTEYTVTKQWDDANSPFRPDSIKVMLQQIEEDGTANNTKEIVELSDENNWTYKWEGLPKIKGSTGNDYEYSYKVEEVNLPAGYTPVLDEEGNLENRLDPVSVKVEKVWENDEDLERYRPETVTLRLYANGEPYHDDIGKEAGSAEGYREITLNSNNGWEGEFTDLPQYYYKQASGDAEDAESTDDSGDAENTESSNTVEEVASANVSGVVGEAESTDASVTVEEAGSTDASVAVEEAGSTDASGDDGDDDTFSGTYEAIPIEYSVKEVVNGEVVEEGGTVTGNNEFNAKYTVSYTVEDGSTTESGTTDDEATTDDKCVATLTATNTLQTSFQIVKKGMVSGTEVNSVEGAEFTLTPYKTGTEDSDGSGSDAEETKSYVGTSNKDGVIEWKETKILSRLLEGSSTSVPKGTYLLKETKSPAGYALNAEGWIVTVDNYGRVSIETVDGTKVEPESGQSVDSTGAVIFTYVFHDEVIYELPSTGGPGIYWYMFGGVLFIAAASLIAYKKKHREVFGE